jgi:hypothetical protein
MGTDAKIRRIKVVGPDGDVMVPMYSGNAFRGKLRRVAADDFLSRIGVDRRSGAAITDKLYFCLFSGGSLQKGVASSHIEVGQKRDLRKHVPFLSLFGTAFGSQMLAGKARIGFGVPIAKETVFMTGVDSSVSVWDIVDEVFYTRRDDLEDKDKGQDPHQMKYSVECLAPNTGLAHEMVLCHPNEIELACFGAVMRLFCEDPVLGGKSGIGHGRAKMDYAPGWPESGLYYDYLEAEKDSILGYVRGLEARLG